MSVEYRSMGWRSSRIGLPSLVALGIIISSAGLATSFNGCVGTNGDKMHRSKSYRAADGSFGLEYVSPPWELSKNGIRDVRLQIEAEVFGFSLGSSVPPSHILLAAKVNLKDSLEDLIDIEELNQVLEDNGIELDTDASLSKIPDEIPDLGDTTGFDTEIPEDLGELGESGDGDTAGILDDPNIPEYLIDVDLKNSRDVAVAELNFLIDQQNARIDQELQKFQTRQGQTGVVYQVVIDPGVFVRNFYFPTQDETLRVSVFSLFDLQTIDVDVMIGSVRTDAPVKEKH